MNDESMACYNLFWSDCLAKVDHLFGADVRAWLASHKIDDFRKQSVGLMCQLSTDIESVTYLDLLKFLDIDLNYYLKWQRTGDGKYMNLWNTHSESEVLQDICINIEILFGKGIEYDFKRLMYFTCRVRHVNLRYRIWAVLSFNLDETAYGNEKD